MRRTRSCRSKSVAETQEAKTIWQWKGDDGEWEPYPPEVCVQLDTAKQAGEKSMSLAIGPGYEVDLVKMTQTNTVTKYKRKIRLQKVKSEDVDEGNAPNGKNGDVVQVKEEKEEEEEQPVSKKRRNEGRSQRANKVKPVVKEESGEEVVKTVIMKGKAPVDPECKAKIGKAHIYSEGADVYDVMLNQVDIEDSKVWGR